MSGRRLRRRSQSDGIRRVEIDLRALTFHRIDLRALTFIGSAGVAAILEAPRAQ